MIHEAMVERAALDCAQLHRVRGRRRKSHQARFDLMQFDFLDKRGSGLDSKASDLMLSNSGEMAEWLKAAVC